MMHGENTMTYFRFDRDGRPEPTPLPCPKCGYEWCYLWGFAPRHEMRPNAACPSCQYNWVYQTLKPLNTRAHETRER